jgi:2,4-dienoyl-CoA reductase-like NADH-dependent reductase (Old Yellow Enzyme family)
MLFEEMHMALLTRPFRIRGVEFRNRIAVSPMCQYSCEDGLANDWHLVHLGSRAVGGAGLVFVEATGVSPEGRISPSDVGLWSEEHIAPLKRITDFMHAHGAIAGIQLAHAGRKGSTARLWEGGKSVHPAQGGWTLVAPSAVKFSDDYPVPAELDEEGIAKVKDDFAKAVTRALRAGFKVIEIHAAHGYLLNQFLSPLANQRKDQYGGRLENRMRLVIEIVKSARDLMSNELPLFVRISGTDWVDGGWTPEDSVVLAKQLKAVGADVIDCSSGGVSPKQKIPVGEGYQVFIAKKVKQEVQVLTGAVGLITRVEHAEAILQNGEADMVLFAREMLREPYWANNAAFELGDSGWWPAQYERAAPKKGR